MNTLVQAVLDALSVGSMYALLALGLTLVFSVMNLINFAYGIMLVWSAYTLSVVADLAPGFLVGALVAIAASTVLSVALGYIAFRPFIGKAQSTLLITSFGVLLAVQYVAIVAFGEQPRVLPIPDWLARVITVGDLRVPVLQLVTIAITAVLVTAFYLLLGRTSYGAQLRAAAERPEVARLMGIKPNRVLMLAFVISGVIAGVVGVLWFARAGAITPRSDLEPTLKAFVALILGGLGRPSGAIYGGIALGAIEVSMSLLLPVGAIPYTASIVFALVILMLLFRPQGIVGGKAVEL